MKKLLQETINEAINLKAEACDVIVNSGESLSLSAQNEKLEKYKIAKTAILGIRVIKNKRVGLAYSESFDKDAILFAVKSAIENSEYADINEYEEIAYKNAEDFIQNKSEIVDNSSIEEKIEMAIKLEAEIKRRDKRVTAVPYNGLSFSESKNYYMNSLGTYTETSNASIGATTSALVKSGDVTSMHYVGVVAKSLASFDLNHSVEECLEHAVNWLEAKPVPSGNYDVIFSTEVLGELLYSFSNYLSAKEAMEKTNPWESKLNQAVAFSKFTLIDVPAYPDAYTKYYVDSEGVPKKDLTLIENGILKSFYHNTATAKYFKTATTGHASRSAKTSLNVSGTNWLIKPGTMTENDLSAGTYLEILDTMGLGRGDNLSGDFSFGASGYLVKDGVRIQPVKEITIAGNFNKILTSELKMGATLLANADKTFFSPKIRFSDLYIAGK
ncbi:MAG: hypothetical protein RJA83_1436 [Pseudomonadota bacterium]